MSWAGLALGTDRRSMIVDCLLVHRLELLSHLELDVSRCTRDDPFTAAGVTVVANHEQARTGMHAKRCAASRLTIGAMGLATVDTRCRVSHCWLPRGRQLDYKANCITRGVRNALESKKARDSRMF